MRLHFVLLSLIWLLPAAVVRGQGADFQTPWTAAVQTVEAAALRGDLASLERGLAGMTAARALAPTDEDRALTFYGTAYARWRMVVVPAHPASRRDEVLDAALADLDQAIRLDAGSADAHSLRSGILGMQIGESMWRGMTLGPRAGSATERAKAIDPLNPRVILGEGLAALHTPAMFGGGIDKAERLLRQAMTLFAGEPRDKPWPNWGRFDAHAWLGQILVKKKDFAGARQQYDLARQEGPESGWLHHVLIPALQRAQGGR